MPTRLSTRPATRQPLLYAALAFSTGIVLSGHAWRPPTWWLVAIVVFSGSALYLARRRILISRIR